MSQPTQQEFTCPQCGWKQQCYIWERVEIAQNPKLKEQVLSRELGTFTCQRCAHRLRVEHALLYHDAQRRVMIWLECGHKLPPFEEAGLPVLSLGQAGYKFRRVSSYNELVEKIRIFDDGQDDRAIEMLKLAYAIQQKVPFSQMLFYDGLVEKGGDAKALQLMEASKDGPALQYELLADETFEKVHSFLAQNIDEEHGKWLRVDRNYAAGMLIHLRL